MKPHLWLIHFVGLIVPRRLRGDWRQEWEAELQYRELLLADWDKLNREARLDLLRRSLGAFWDALRLQPRRLEDEMFQDLRYGARMLTRNPGFTIVAILTLALGIGANTAIFSVINAVLLRPLPFVEPDRLLAIAETHPEIPRLQVATPDFKDWQLQAQSFEAMAAWSLQDLSKLVITDVAVPEQLQNNCISPNLFPLLGISPVVGRNFLPDEDQEGHDRVAIVSHRLWERLFASDPNLVNSTIRLNGEQYTVVGIMPKDAQFPFGTDVWLPLSQLGKDLIVNRVRHPLEVVGRLKAGRTVEQAQVEMEAIAARLQQTFPATNKTIGVKVDPLHKQLTGSLKPALLALFGTVGLVLLITCANVSNLLLARAAQRRREVALRAALGAGRGRLFRQFLTESSLLGLLGGIGGLLLATWSMPLLRAAMPNLAIQQLPALTHIAIDLPMLAFTLLVTTLTTGLFGLLPALQLSRLNLNEALKEGGRALSGRHRTRGALVIAQVALTMVALVGAGLLLKSFQRILQVETGFRAERILSAEITLPSTKYQQPGQVKDFDQRLLPLIAGLPGVQGVATIDYFPLTVSNAKTRFGVEGKPLPAPGQFPVAQIRNISQDYFDVMRIPLMGGRAFTEDDVLNNRNGFIINQTLARRYFPNEDPIGRKLVMGVLFPNPTAVPIVGVVADVKDLGLDAPVEPEIYAPGFGNQQLLMIRTAGDPAGVAASVRQAVLATDSEQPVRRLRTMEDALSASLVGRRLSATLTGLFALLALLLAAIGIYGVLSSRVSERTQELGIRRALGAQKRDLLKLVVGHGMRLTLMGLAVGWPASLVAGRLMGDLLFGVGDRDPATFASISCLLALIALFACYIPARRAMKVDPLVALRHE